MINLWLVAIGSNGMTANKSLERNPQVPSNARVGGQRSPGEYVLLASLAGSCVFWAYLWVFGTIQLRGNSTGAVVLLLSALGIAALAFWLILRRQLIGAILCSIFYGLQLVSVTLSSGEFIGMNSLPTIDIRIYGDEASPVNLNLVALILFVFSVILCTIYRQRRTDAA